MSSRRLRAGGPGTAPIGPGRALPGARNRTDRLPASVYGDPRQPDTARRARSWRPAVSAVPVSCPLGRARAMVFVWPRRPPRLVVGRRPPRRAAGPCPRTCSPCSVPGDARAARRASAPLSAAERSAGAPDRERALEPPTACDGFGGAFALATAMRDSDRIAPTRRDLLAAVRVLSAVVVVRADPITGRGDATTSTNPSSSGA
jgi:hypothetical protein